MNRPVLPAKLTTCAITLLCTASMLCSAQSPYRPVPNQTWNKTVALDTAFMRVSYEMTFRDALFYSTSEPGGLEDPEVWKTMSSPKRKSSPTHA